MQNFRALGAPPPDPRASGGWGLCPQTPNTAPPLRISGYAPEHLPAIPRMHRSGSSAKTVFKS